MTPVVILVEVKGGDDDERRDNGWSSTPLNPWLVTVEQVEQAKGVEDDAILSHLQG